MGAEEEVEPVSPAAAAVTASWPSARGHSPTRLGRTRSSQQAGRQWRTAPATRTFGSYQARASLAAAAPGVRDRDTGTVGHRDRSRSTSRRKTRGREPARHGVHTEIGFRRPQWRPGSEDPTVTVTGTPRDWACQRRYC